MDRIAIISDVHGNIPAFEAAVDDIRARGIEKIYCLGDLVGKGPSSAESTDMHRDLCDLVVYGNWDVAVSRRHEWQHPIYRWHREQMGSERLEWMADLPFSHDFCLSGRRIRLLHATPQRVFVKIPTVRSYSEMLTMFENTELTGYGPQPDIVIHGHSHRTQVNNLNNDEKFIFNPGSIGNSTDIALVSYGILEGVLDSLEPAPFSFQIVRLPYDIERALADGRRFDMPDYEYYEFELRTARYRGDHAGYQAMMREKRIAALSPWRRPFARARARWQK